MKKFILLPILVIGLLAVSCKKEGCTDGDATNYNSKAKKDDGSCTYEGRYVIWWDQQTSQNLDDYASYTLFTYVENVLVSTQSTSLFWNSAPDCGASNTVTVSRDLKGNKSESVPFYIKDEYDEIFWQGTLDFEANKCVNQKVVY